MIILTDVIVGLVEDFERSFSWRAFVESTRKNEGVCVRVLGSEVYILSDLIWIGLFEGGMDPHEQLWS